MAGSGLTANAAAAADLSEFAGDTLEFRAGGFDGGRVVVFLVSGDGERFLGEQLLRGGGAAVRA